MIPQYTGYMPSSSPSPRRKELSGRDPESSLPPSRGRGRGRGRNYPPTPSPKYSPPKSIPLPVSSPKYSPSPSVGGPPPTPSPKYSLSTGGPPPTPSPKYSPSPGGPSPTPSPKYSPSPGGPPPTPSPKYSPSPGGPPPTPSPKYSPSPGGPYPTPSPKYSPSPGGPHPTPSPKYFPFTGKPSYPRSQTSKPSVSTETRESSSGGVSKVYLLNPKVVKAFFGTRNGISFEQANLKYGENYTEETLACMTPHVRADEITSEIVKRMPISPFIVFECCAGIGGNTLSFLDNPHVSAVYSYEMDEKRRQMLQNNIRAYRLEKKFFVGEAFEGVPKEFAGSVLYIDPPWLPSHISAVESSPSQYILHGIRVGPYTLEEEMDRCRHCAMVVIRVPPGYQLDPVPGFTCDKVSLKKSDVFFCTSAEGMDYARTHFPLKEKSSEGEEPEEVWAERLKNFLKDFIKPVVEPEQLDLYFTPEAMEIWKKAFTHESYSISDNYEELETLGDGLLKFLFIRYLMRRYDGISKNQISALLDRYMSKSYQRSLSQKYDFGSYVRTRGVKVNIHILEDLFEAFFGAFVEVSDLIVEGLGPINCQNMIIEMFDSIKFKFEYAYGRSKTQIKEFFEKLSWGTPIETKIETEVGVRVIIRLTENALHYLSARGIPVPAEIGAAEATTQKVAVHEAYDNALANLAKYGITREWIAREREHWDFTNLDYLPYLEKARERLKAEGYSRVYFFVPRTGTNVKGCLVQLIGVRQDTQKHVVIDSSPACDPAEGKKELLRRFALSQ